MDGFFFGGGFEVIFSLVFLLILGLFIVGVVRNISQWNKNNHSPRLTVNANIVAKRADVSHHYHDNGNGAGSTTSSTTYYVTFQVESGDRMELSVGGREYGMLSEGDYGKLSFQGTRYLGFERM